MLLAVGLSGCTDQQNNITETNEPIVPNKPTEPLGKDTDNDGLNLWRHSVVRF